MTSANGRRRGSRHVEFGKLLRATLVARPNRFLALVHTPQGTLRAACRDPGRLEQLLVPGAELRLRRAPPSPSRRTAYDLVLARQGRTWVSLMPALANAVFAAALARGHVAGLRGARVVAREVRQGRSRLDFVLAQRGRRVWTEVKSVGLVRAGVALFPDAPTARGARHLRELLALAQAGQRAQVVFIVQRGDAHSFAPFAARDPEFTRALVEAVRGGVRLRAYACRVGPTGCTLVRRLPVRLPRAPGYDRRPGPGRSARGER